jgi:hypothetical protein
LQYKNEYSTYDGILGRNILNRGGFCLEAWKGVFTLTLPPPEPDFEPYDIEETG